MMGGPPKPYEHNKVEPPRGVGDVPRYLRELLGGFFSRWRVDKKSSHPSSRLNAHSQLSSRDFVMRTLGLVDIGFRRLVPDDVQFRDPRFEHSR